MDKSQNISAQYDKIYRYCYYRLHRKETAEDITQETFLRFYQKKQYQFAENPLKLLYTIAGNLCIDESRKNSCLYLEDVKAQSGELTQNDGFEDRLLTGQILKAAMSHLEETERDIVFLRLVNEESFSVIAGLLSLSRFAVYRRYDNAVRKLRKELKSYDEME